MTLFARCLPHATLAIVGTAKNVGKTTCLNHLVDAYAARGTRLGLTSIGRDGEDIDAVTDRPKPRITPPVGTLVATSAVSARRSAARLREVAPTPFRTALGAVSLYEVTGPGFVEIAGPVTVRDTVDLNAMLRAHGARTVLVDGAIDRRASASAEVADAVILATGLSFDPEPATVLDHTASVRRWLMLAAPPALDHPLQTGVLTWSGDFHPWTDPTVLERGEELSRWLPADTRRLVLRGALTEAVARQLAKSPTPFELVVPDGTHVLMQPSTFDRLEARGIRCYAQRPLTLAAVTVNPTRPDGRATDAAAFLAAMQQRLAPTPVYDLHLHPPGVADVPRP